MVYEGDLLNYALFQGSRDLEVADGGEGWGELEDRLVGGAAAALRFLSGLGERATSSMRGNVMGQPGRAPGSFEVAERSGPALPLDQRLVIKAKGGS